MLGKREFTISHDLVFGRRPDPFEMTKARYIIKYNLLSRVSYSHYMNLIYLRTELNYPYSSASNRLAKGLMGHKATSHRPMSRLLLSGLYTVIRSRHVWTYTASKNSVSRPQLLPNEQRVMHIAKPGEIPNGFVMQKIPAARVAETPAATTRLPNLTRSSRPARSPGDRPRRPPGAAFRWSRRSRSASRSSTPRRCGARSRWSH